jgi:cytochrome c oxidase cbb3-type subunit 3
MSRLTTTYRGTEAPRNLSMFLVSRCLSVSWLVNVVAFMTTVASLSAQGGPYQRQRIDTAGATRGRAVYAQHCINCHGSTAKGTERGPDLIRSVTVLRDRLGSTIGPAIKTSATHQAQLTGAQILDVSHFLHQRVEAIVSNRNPTAPLNVLTGDPEEGRRYFNGAGKCSACHSPTGDLSGIVSRLTDPANLQQRFLFPTLPRDGRRQVDVIVSTASGQSVMGTLVRMDDFSVALRDASGEYRSFTRGPGVSVAVRDPLATHHELLDLYTDEDMHNITAYLSTLK